MRRLFLRGLAAHVAAGRTLYALSVLGVALGVGAVLSIQIVNRSALGAFRGTMQAISGEADLSLVGRGPTLDETLLVQALATDGVAAAWPLERTDVALAGADGFYLEVLGLDFLSPARVPWGGETFAGTDPLTTPGWCAISPELARDRGWRVGDRFEVSSGSRRVRLTVGALIDFRRVSPTATTRLVLMDIAQAQGRLGRRGRIAQIDVALADGASREAVAARLAAAAPGVRAVTPEQREREASNLLDAFRLNLTALSLVSLFVGAFLVYTSVRASLVRRRAEYGLLRSLGASRGQVLGLILGEVVVLGLLGTAVGIPLGWAAAALNVDLVSATLTNVYLLEAIERLRMPAWLFVLAAVVGVGGALVGALAPALETARRDPQWLLADYTLHDRADLRAGRLFAAGLALLLVAVAAWAAFGRGWRPGGFALGLALLAALPLLAPWIVKRATRLLRPAGFGLLHGVKGLGLRLGTTSFAAASLAVAVALVVGITLMVGSFRRTVDVWLGDTLHADIYVTTESWRRARSSATLSPEIVEALARTPGVRRIDRLRQFFVVDDTGRRISVVGVDMGLPGGESRFQLYRGDADEAFRRLREEGAVIVSEPLYRKLGLGIGDRLTLDGPDGPVSFPIAAINYDYSNEGGGAAMDLATMERAFGPGPINNVALYLEDGVDPEATIDRLKTTFAGVPLELRSYRTLRREVFDIFDQTFAVTRLLQAMSLIIAAAGITLTLLVLAREKVAELALYRALGASRRQIFAVFLGKGLGIACFGLALGLLAGLALAAILIFVINRDWFGWTIAVHWPVRALVEEALVILAAAGVASLYPALRASRTPATELSRENV